MTRVFASSVRPRYLRPRLLAASILLALLALPASATLDAKAYGAQGDGVTDDTASLNNAFAAACAAADDVHLPAGVYVVGPLAPLHGCAVTISGDGSASTVLKLRSSRSQPMWSFLGTPGQALALTLQDLALDGGHLASAGLAIEHYQAVILNRLLVHDFGTPGYALGHHKSFDGIYIRNVENVHITDAQSTGNERYGIELQAVHSSVVRNADLSFNGSMGGVSEQNFEGPLDGPIVAQWLDNTLLKNGGGGIDVETDPRLPPAQGILEGNTVDSCGDDGWDAGWALVLGLHAFGTIANNTVHRFAANSPKTAYTDAIVYGRNAGPISILNNTVTGTRSRAIAGSSGLHPALIFGNTLSENGMGVFLYQCPDVLIARNTITHSAQGGIIVALSRGTVITGNQFINNAADLKINGHAAVQIASARAGGSPT